MASSKTTQSSKPKSHKKLLIAIGIVVFAVIFIAVYELVPNSSYNQSIAQKAIDQRNPAWCALLFGSTTETYALPLDPSTKKPRSGSSTFSQIEFLGRCIDQANHGSNYVY